MKEHQIPRQNTNFAAWIEIQRFAEDLALLMGYQRVLSTWWLGRLQ